MAIGSDRPTGAVAGSLRRAILAWVALPAALVLLIGMIHDFYTGVDLTTGAYDQALLSTAIALEPHVTQLDGEPIFKLPAAAEDVLRADRYDRIFFAIRTPAGRHVAGDADMPALPMPAGEQRYFADTSMRGEYIRVAVLRLPTAAGELQFVVGETRVKRERTAREFVRNVALVNAVLLAAVAAAVFYGTDRGLAPLARLRRELQSRSHRDLRPLDAATAPDELRPFIEEINSLFARLEAAAATQNRFVANAAHQLRTPLAGLKTQLELARAQLLPASAAELIAQAHEAVVRIARMANQLLALARVDPAAVKLRRDALDLATLIGADVDHWVHTALAADIDLGFELEAAPMHGDETLLRELAANLIDNAIRYAGAGARVTVRTGVADGAAVLEIEDDGPGIATAERSRVLERFYRVPGSPGPGSGLGLAIVAEIAALHDAQLLLEDARSQRGARLGGLRVSVRFAPRQAPGPALLPAKEAASAYRKPLAASDQR